MAKRKTRFTEATLWPDKGWQDPWDMLDEIEAQQDYLNDYRWPYTFRGTTSLLGSQWDQRVRFDGRVYKVNDSFLAGPFPGDLDRAQQTENLTWLLDQGVTRIISLMERGERDWSMRPIREYNREAKALGAKRGIKVACDRFAIRDLTAPTVKQTVKVLDRIDRSMADGETVYVHCLGGYGRTGAVVGCWIARHGLGQGINALDYLDYLRRDEVTKCVSPQTQPQIARVIGWKKGK